MKDAVRNAWFNFSTTFEGRVPWMYLDIRGLVTIGIGNLIDPISEALRLDMVKPDGKPASESDIRQEWTLVKSLQKLAPQGHRSFEKLAQLRMTDNAIETMVLSKLDRNDRFLANRFRGWEDMPASAQMGVHSMSWAMGPAFSFPRFQKALMAGDWRTCANECRMDDSKNPGLTPRNKANEKLFLFCLAGDPSVVSWP